MLYRIKRLFVAKKIKIGRYKKTRRTIEEKRIRSEPDAYQRRFSSHSHKQTAKRRFVYVGPQGFEPRTNRL